MAEAAEATRRFARASLERVDPEATAALAAVLQHQTPEEITELLALITSQPARDMFCVALVELWSDRQPKAAAVVVERATSGQLQADLFGRIVPAWGQSDLAGAIEWVRNLPPSAGQTAALVHLSYAWVEHNPREAVAFAAGQPAGSEQFLRTALDQWARQDGPASLAWAQQLPEGDKRDRAFAVLVGALAQSDPRAAAEFALRLPAGGAQQDAVISAVSSWAAREPAVAAQWVANFPAGPQRRYAIENVFYAWTESDPVAAVAWLQQLPAGTDRDTALHAGAGRLVESNPDLAVQLAVGIADEALRNRQVERAARAWLARDRQAASAWIAQSNLPLALKRQLLPGPSS